MLYQVTLLCALTLLALGVPPDRAEDEVQQLIASLSDEHYDTVTAATERLAELGRHGAAAKDKLIEMLDGPYAAHAAEALATMGPDAARRVLEAIDKGAARLGVPRNLPTAGPEIIAEVMTLKRFPELARGKSLAEDYFIKFEAKYILAAATQMLTHEDTEVRKLGATLLAYLRDASSPAIGSLADALKAATKEDEILTIASSMVAIGKPSLAYADDITQAAIAVANHPHIGSITGRLFRLAPDCRIIAKMLRAQPSLIRGNQDEIGRCNEVFVDTGRNALRSPSATTRANGLQLIALATSGRRLTLTSSEILQIIEDDDVQVRKTWFSAAFFANKVQLEAVHISKLIGLLNSADATTRVGVITTLSKHAMDRPEVREALLEVLKESDPSLDFLVLAKIGQSEDYDDAIIDAIIEKTRSTDARTRGVAVEALSNLKVSSPNVIAALLEILEAESDDPQRYKVQQMAIRALSDLAASGHVSNDLLISLIQRPLPEIETNANIADSMIVSEAVRGLGLAGSEYTPYLLDLLEEKQTRHDAAIALNLTGGLTPGHLDWADLRLGGQFKSVVTLESAIEDMCDAAVPYLLEALSSDNAEIRSSAAMLIGRIGSRLDVVEPALAELISDGNDYTAKASTSAIRQLSSEPRISVDNLVTRLHQGNPMERQQALDQLVVIGNHEAVPPLIKLAHSDDRQLARDVLLTLAQIDPTDTKVIQLCIEALNHPDDRPVALFAINVIGPAAVDAAPKLVPLLQYDTLSYRSPRIRDILVKFGPPAIPHLVAGLEAPEWRVRAGAAEALSEIQPPAKDALPRLEALAGDPNYIVAKSARDAIKRIRAELERG